MRCSKRTQLPRLNRTGCCIVPRETTHAHTASSAQGVSPCKNWTLSRTKEVEKAGRFSQTLPKSEESHGARRRVRRSAAGFLSSLRIGGGECLSAAGAQEGDEAVAGGSGGATVDFDYGGMYKMHHRWFECCSKGNARLRREGVSILLKGENEQKISKGVYVGCDGGDGSVG